MRRVNSSGNAAQVLPSANLAPPPVHARAVAAPRTAVRSRHVCLAHAEAMTSDDDARTCRRHIPQNRTVPTRKRWLTFPLGHFAISCVCACRHLLADGGSGSPLASQHFGFEGHPEFLR